jgi:hypothetical protein
MFLPTVSHKTYLHYPKLILRKYHDPIEFVRANPPMIADAVIRELFYNSPLFMLKKGHLFHISPNFKKPLGKARGLAEDGDGD